jgi:hypothetical protein
MAGPDKGQDIFENIREDVKEMAKDGLGHPGSKQVITGAAAGALIGGLVLGTWPLGLIAGAGAMLFWRAKQ